MTMFKESLSQFSTQNLTLSQFVKMFFTDLFMNPLTAMAAGKVLPTVIFAILLGIALVVSKEKNGAIPKFLNELFDLTMLIVGWIMRLAPVGIMALLLQLTATQNISLLKAVGRFVCVVMATTLLHGSVTLPLILYSLTGMTPKIFFKGARDALITAFSTSSSSATLPVTIQCVEKNLKVNKDVAGFVLPLGATVNMDGTALYEAVAAIFVANLTGVHLNIVQQVIVFFMAILASIGAPGIPSAGMVTMIMVLQAVGLPAEAVAILIPVDRFLDTIRTAVNVEGDMVGAVIVERYAGKSS